MAGTGGWTSPEEFAAEVTFFKTPHRLLVTGQRGPTDSAVVSQVRWNCAPLGVVDPAGLAIG